MKRGSVVVDVAIDQGGCVETSKPTTHANPTYLVDDVVHYCVANMPGGVPRTSTMALNKATLPFLIKLADQGYKKTLQGNKNYLAGLVYKETLLAKGVSDAFNLNIHSRERFIKRLNRIITTLKTFYSTAYHLAEMDGIHLIDECINTTCYRWFHFKTRKTTLKLH